jgi:serine/threonine protein kinase/tetratricopeptide (TPR) repeat protein
MAKSRSSRIQSLFERAMDMDPISRDLMLQEQCADDPALRTQVERLLAHDELVAETFLQSPVRGVVQPGPDVKRVGTVVAGRYRLKRVLGRGGMGVVWLAEQQHPRREVALKLVRNGLLTPELRRRFDFESNILGRLKHPGIAQLFEAGVFVDDDEHRPFFAMEFVEGVPLTQFVKQHRLELHERLRLFIRICYAVQHAHHKGVIHRDLKPANILVTQESEPKILDFGVARATAPDQKNSTLLTSAGQLIGTLPYMSPEQVEGPVERLDTRSDVYSLGVILHELLVGCVPHDVDQHSIVEAVRIICDQDPLSLSTHDRSFRGDLDTIVHKALSKDPGRRYQTASDLAGDIARYLRHEPIIARPLTLGYQLSKFSRRNKGLVVGLAVAFLVLVTGTVVSTNLALDLKGALNKAARHQRVTNAVNDFLNKDLLGQASPAAGGTHDVTVRQVVDRAAATIGDRFPTDPLVQASIRMTLGTTYLHLGAYDETVRHVQVAQQIYAQELGAGDGRTLEAQHCMAFAYLRSWKLDEARAVLDDAMVEVRLAEVPIREHAHILSDMAYLHRRHERYAEAESVMQQSIAILENVPDLPLDVLAKAQSNFAMALSQHGKNVEAEQLVRTAIDHFKRATGPDSVEVAHNLNNLGHYILRNKDDGQRFEAAEVCFEEAYAIRCKRLGEGHPETIRTLYSIGVLYLKQERFDLAEPTFRKAWDQRLQVEPEDAFDNLSTMFCIAKSLIGLGRGDEAGPIYTKMIELGQKRYGASHPSIRSMRGDVYEYHKERNDDTAIETLALGYITQLQAEIETDSAKLDTFVVLSDELIRGPVERYHNPEQALGVLVEALQLDQPITPKFVEVLCAVVQEAVSKTQARDALLVTRSLISEQDDASRERIDRAIEVLAD